MKRLLFPDELESVVCVGAHADDIEIGAGATIAALAAAQPNVRFTFIVLTADDRRSSEAVTSARALLGERVEVHIGGFEDGYLPYRDPAGVKDYLKEIMPGNADLVFSPSPHDAHQDHRFIGKLLGAVCRKQPLLGYEIVKYDGDLGRPNVYVPLSTEAAEAKITHVEAYFGSQASKPWFSSEVFMGIMRLRGVEADAPEGYAEAFYLSKLVVSPTA